MSNQTPRRFPVTVSYLPTVRCQICQRTVAFQPGQMSQVLTEHYRQAHPEKLGLEAGRPGGRRASNGHT